MRAATELKFCKNKFNQTWIEYCPVRGVSNDPYKFFCVPCCKKLSCNHQVLNDVTDHSKKESLIANVESSKKTVKFLDK